MRIHTNCVSSEDIKNACGGDNILYLQSLGHYPWILNNKNKEIGRIVPLEGGYLGDDVVIERIDIYDDEPLSKELTEKYRYKILIFGFSKDIWN